jgi:hypothetical protein
MEIKEIIILIVQFFVKPLNKFVELLGVCPVVITIS